jgi:hypothetical protein
MKLQGSTPELYSLILVPWKLIMKLQSVTEIVLNQRCRAETIASAPGSGSRPCKVSGPASEPAPAPTVAKKTCELTL